jgi:ribonuclease E
MALRRRYKIQDVIQRRQVLLVQVVKEERGNKGAALTTYLSLAGRYCVLMPNSSHGGGISRKISSASDRKRLKTIIGELGLPKSMGCIVRTAGLSRTKVEIKRDFDYLARLWDEIRETTLGSSAPALIHSDSDLIKRAIRDIYNKDIEDVVVEGEAGYRAAKDFMKLLMPSHSRRVKAYSDPVPLFQRYGAEDQLTAMYDPVVQLKSGGYIVINPTEALVSIDINSGRSTKEHGIEATALNTNLEAAREIARQLRLRDMAGLVVIDFIDMEYGSNVRKVEKVMKDALKNDRARIQVGRISSFGLMEMSRQRLRTVGPGPHRGVGRSFGAAPDRGRGRQGQGQRHHALRQPGSGDLRPQRQARRPRRDRGPLWRARRGDPRRRKRRRQDARRLVRPASRVRAPVRTDRDRGRRRRPARRGLRGGRERRARRA